MNLNTKNWRTRIDEILTTIRAADGDELADVIDANPAVNQQLSNSLHLNKQGTSASRQIWRAIALVERLFFHNPRNLADIVEIEDTEEMLQLYVSALGVVGNARQDQYVNGSAADVAEAVLGNELMNCICQTSVERSMKLASTKLWNQNVTNPSIADDFFGGALNDYETADPLHIPRDSVVCLYRRKFGPTSAFDYSHTMISLGPGACMGSNNECIGAHGSHFQRIDLRTYFRFADGEDPILLKAKRDEAPDWAQPMKFYSRRISEIIP